MNPTASPRHPFKAIAVVLAMFVVVHAARAHVEPREHGATHVNVVHGDRSDADCRDTDTDTDIDIDIDDGGDDDNDAKQIDVITGGDDWT